MSDLNNISMSGRMVKAPELKATVNGKMICIFTLASNKYAKNEEGKKTIFIECKALGKKAEAIAKHFDKGDEIIFSGSVDQDKWEYEGKKYSKLYLLVSDFTFGRKKGKTENGIDDIGVVVERTDDMPF